MRHKYTKQKQIPGLFLIVITMTAIAVFVQVDRMRNKSADIRAKAYRQTATGVRIEAEEMTLSRVSVDPSGTSIQFSAPPTDTASAPSTTATTAFICPPSGSPAARTAIIDVDLNQHANYKMWIQMMGKGSVWLQVDSLYCAKVGGSADMPANTWQWVDFQNRDTSNKIPSPLIGTGHHIIKLIGNASEPGVSIDRILMMIDISCIPTGNGDMCIGDVVTSTSTPTLTPTPANITVPVKSSATIPKIITTSLPVAQLNISYGVEVVVTDATISDILGMTATDLPAELTISSCSQTTGLGGTKLTCPIIGTPKIKGKFFPVFTAIDAEGNKMSKKIKLQVE